MVIFVHSFVFALATFDFIDFSMAFIFFSDIHRCDQQIMAVNKKVSDTFKGALNEILALFKSQLERRQRFSALLQNKKRLTEHNIVCNIYLVCTDFQINNFTVFSRHGSVLYTFNPDAL